MVIAAAELGAPALAGLILLGLGPVGIGDLGREPRIGKLYGGLALGRRTLGCWGEDGRKREGQNYDPIEQNPSPGDHIPEKGPGLSDRAHHGNLCFREDKTGQQASGTSLLKVKAAMRPRHSSTEQASGLDSWPWGEQTLTVEAAAFDPGLPPALSRP